MIQALLRAKRPAHTRHAPKVVETQLLLQTILNVGGYPLAGLRILAEVPAVKLVFVAEAKGLTLDDGYARC